MGNNLIVWIGEIVVHDRDIEKYAKEYINDVNKICQTILKAYGLKSREELIKHRTAQPMGEFHLNNRYCFHGRGCSFSNDEIEIDWDFGYGDIWCGLDYWKLFNYIRDNKDSNISYNGIKIKEVFEKWVAQKKMIKKAGLYYFVTLGGSVCIDFL
jgi:hypothetical protein